MNASRSATSMYCLRPPGNWTTGINPCQMRSLIAQVVRPRYSAACFKGNRRGDIGFSILVAVCLCVIPVRCFELCLNCSGFCVIDDDFSFRCSLFFCSYFTISLLGYLKHEILNLLDIDRRVCRCFIRSYTSRTFQLF